MKRFNFIIFFLVQTNTNEIREESLFSFFMLCFWCNSIHVIKHKVKTTFEYLSFLQYTTDFFFYKTLDVWNEQSKDVILNNVKKMYTHKLIKCKAIPLLLERESHTNNKKKKKENVKRKTIVWIRWKIWIQLYSWKAIFSIT